MSTQGKMGHCNRVAKCLVDRPTKVGAEKYLSKMAAACHKPEDVAKVTSFCGILTCTLRRRLS